MGADMTAIASRVKKIRDTSCSNFSKTPATILP
jgi:hypothetical protein